MEQTQPKLKIVNGHVYATSLEVAKRFNKSHDNVVKAIRNILEEMPSDFSAVIRTASTHSFAFAEGA